MYKRQIPAGTGLPEVREDLKRREQERDEAIAAELAAAKDVYKRQVQSPRSGTAWRP